MKKNSTTPIPAEVSFGEYFDAQRLRLENLIKDKNKQLNSEWMENYKERKKNPDDQTYTNRLD